MKNIKWLLSFLLIIFCQSLIAQNSKEKSRIIVIGAHPDDCEYAAGGTAALLSNMGHAVKFLAVTNGDAGHQTMKGQELAARRYLETQEVAKRLGVTYDVLDNHDGALLPTLEVRLQIIKKIREWNADVVIAPRPNDYHPDHRYTGVLVQDAAYMVEVPNVAPEVPALRKTPVFLYAQDHFQRPNPFRPDIVVDISNVYERKISAIDAHVSQFYEWMPWIGRYEKDVPAGKEERLKWLMKFYDQPMKANIRKAMVKWHGIEKAAKSKYAEAFEVCEYGAQPNEAEIRRLFPMLIK
ncbi:MAG: PIG-L deacetylase family protein [Chitinophagaceae bacterium]